VRASQLCGFLFTTLESSRYNFLNIAKRSVPMPFIAWKLLKTQALMRLIRPPVNAKKNGFWCLIFSEVCHIFAHVSPSCHPGLIVV